MNLEKKRLSERALNTITHILMGGGGHREEEDACDHGGRDWRDAATVKCTWSHQKLEEARNRFPAGASEGSVALPAPSFRS